MLTITEDNLKKAFWETFHDSGEVWFGCEADTEVWWNEFVSNILKQGEEQ
jgi:hypothetical protein